LCCPALLRACGNHSGDAERSYGIGLKPFCFIPEPVFAFIPESCSASSRNTVRNHPGIAFTLPRIPHQVPWPAKARFGEFHAPIEHCVELELLKSRTMQFTQGKVMISVALAITGIDMALAPQSLGQRRPHLRCVQVQSLGLCFVFRHLFVPFFSSLGPRNRTCVCKI
jgi:hypothetical protein